MDIEIVIDERGRVTFSAFPEGLLDVALGLDPHNPSLLERARSLQRTHKVTDDEGQYPAGDDELRGA